MTLLIPIFCRSPYLFALLLAVTAALPAHAQGEIVYSARHYHPPGDRRISNFHLYRVNPDGTGRRQITSGSSDNYMPLWSPDGARILYQRETTGKTSRISLCWVGANGGKITSLIPDASKATVEKKDWLADSRRVVLFRVDQERIADAGSVEIWDTVTRKRTARYEACDGFALSPDRQTLFLDKTGSGVFVDLKTGKQQTIPMEFSPSLWADNETLVSLESAPADEEASSFYGVKHVVLAGRDGREKKRFTPQFASGITVAEGDGPAAYLRLAPGSPTMPGTVVLYSEHRFIYWYGVLRLSDGKVIAERSHFRHPVWSPDGKRFVTKDTPQLTPYGKTGKKEFTGPLCIGTSLSQKPRAIVSGMVWVQSADWRGSRQ